MSLTPTQLNELQLIVEALRGEFPNSDDAVWQGAIRIQKGGLGPVTGAGGQAAFDIALAEIVVCADDISTVQGRQGGPGSSLDEAIFQVIPVEDNLPAGALGDIIYLDMAPNVYASTGVVSIVPAGPNSVSLAEVGTDVLRTVPAASGGIEVNNLSTGIGFERVLTTSDSQAHNAEFVVMSLSANIPNERVLTAGTDISIVDGGAGGNVTINADSQNPFATPLGILGDINLPSPPLDNITSLLEFRDLADAVVAGHVGMAGQFGRLELSNFIEGRILRLTTVDGGSDNDDAGAIEILAGLGETPSGDGGDIDITTGAAGVGGTGSGGDLTLRAGQSSSGGTAEGGDITLISGQGGQSGTGGRGGPIQLSAGGSGGSDNDGGEIRLNAGGGSRDGGDVVLVGGVGGTVRGGNIDITSGQSGGAALPSGDIILEVNDVTGGASGNVFVNTRTGIGAQGGSVEASQDPGLVSIYGVGVDAGIVAGKVEIWGGYANFGTDAAVGGDVEIYGGGAGGGPALGGSVRIFGGEADAEPGDVFLLGGTATVSGTGGAVNIDGGPGFLAGNNGGLVNITGGLGIGTGPGGRVDIKGGPSGSGATGDGSDVDITGGFANSTNGDGGDVNFRAGIGSGANPDGRVRVISGSGFRIEGPNNLNWVQFQHNDTDLTVTTQNTVDWNITGITAINAGTVDLDIDVMTATSFNGVLLTTAGAATNFLNEAGGYSVPAGSGGTVTSSGSPLVNEVAVFTGATDIDSDSTFTWDGTILNATTIGATGNGTIGLPSVQVGAEIDTGFYRPIVDAISVTLGGVQRWSFQPTLFNYGPANGPALFNGGTVSATVPGLGPVASDIDSGIGQGAFDEVSIIAGGVEGLRFTELNSGIIQAPNASLAITAFATGGQGSAVQLDESYSVLSVVATTGDSVKLPPVFAINSVMYIKNDGANAADVFPATGDDLGAGANTAVSIASGESLSFIATVADATWTQLLVDTGGGSVTASGTPLDNQIAVFTGLTDIDSNAGFTYDATQVILTATVSPGLEVHGTTSQLSVFDSNSTDDPLDSFTMNMQNEICFLQGTDDSGALTSALINMDVTTQVVRLGNTGGEIFLNNHTHIEDNTELRFGDAAAGDAVMDYNSATDELLTVMAAGVDWIVRMNAENAIVAIADGNVVLSYNGNNKIYTTIDGARIDDSLYIDEQTAANGDITAQGQFWVRDDAPNLPMFTNDVGTDQITDPSLSELNVQDGNYTFLISDKGKTIAKQAGGAGETYTIPANASVAYVIGTWIAVDNDGGGDLTIAITTDVLVGTDGVTGSRTLGDNHRALMQKITATRWRYQATDL